jgi:hypothetical protein
VVINLAPRNFEVSLGFRVPSFVLLLSQPAASFQTVIDWGDGARSAGTLPVTNAAVVIGSHTYESPSAVPATAAPPPAVPPVRPNSPGGSDDKPTAAPDGFVATAGENSPAPETDSTSGQVVIQVALEGVGEQHSTKGTVWISIRLNIVTTATSFQAVSATLDDVSVVLALAPVLDNPDHLPPVPPLPPGVTGPPWKPSPPEFLPAPHVPGFEASKAPIARSSLPGQSRSSSPSFLADTDPIAPVEGTNSGSVRGTALTTALAGEPDTDRVMNWFQRRARELALLLDADRTKPSSPDAPADVFKDAASEPAGQPALPRSVPQWLADDPILSLQAIGNDPIAGLLLADAVPRADRGRLLLQPTTPAGNAAAAAPARYFGQLDPAEEAEQEAAVTATTAGRNAPTRRRMGWPSRLLLVVGCALWSLCWFRHAKLTGPRAPVLGDPRREKARSGPTL